MPAPIEASVKRKVIQQWLSGDSRPKIAVDNNIGEGTVGSIVADFKIGLDNSEFGSAREVALQAKKQGLNLSDLASHFRLYNFMKSSGAAEEDIESFIANVSSTGDDIPPENIIQCVNQLFNISKSESIPPDKVSKCIQQKIQEKQKIEEAIKEFNDILQSKNMSIETINEHVKLNEKLNEYNLSFQDIDKLLNVLINAKKNGFDPNLIVRKLRSIRRLEKKQERLKNSCEMLPKKEARYKELIPLANIIWDLHIGRNELISFKVAVNEAAEQYGFPASTAAFHVLNNIRDYDKIGGLKKELNKLTTQVFSVNEICFRQNKSMMAMLNLQSRGITEEQIISLTNILQGNQSIP